MTFASHAISAAWVAVVWKVSLALAKSACKGGFVKQQVGSLYQRNDVPLADGVRAIGVAARGSGRSREPVVRDGLALGSRIVTSILDVIQFGYGYLVEINHVTNDVVGRFLFLEQKPQVGIRWRRGMEETVTDRSS